MKIEIFKDESEKEQKTHEAIDRELKWAIGKIDWTICGTHKLRMLKDLLESLPTLPD